MEVAAAPLLRALREDAADEARDGFGGVLTLYVALLSTFVVIHLLWVLLFPCAVSTLRKQEEDLPAERRVVDKVTIAVFAGISIVFGIIGFGAFYCVVNSRVNTNRLLVAHASRNASPRSQQSQAEYASAIPPPSPPPPPPLSQQDQPDQPDQPEEAPPLVHATVVKFKDIEVCGDDDEDTSKLFRV